MKHSLETAQESLDGERVGREIDRKRQSDVGR